MKRFSTSILIVAVASFASMIAYTMYNIATKRASHSPYATLNECHEIIHDGESAKKYVLNVEYKCETIDTIDLPITFGELFSINQRMTFQDLFSDSSYVPLDMKKMRVFPDTKVAWLRVTKKNCDSNSSFLLGLFCDGNDVYQSYVVAHR